MLFDPENKIVSLCAEGMNHEIAGDYAKAKALFHEAWESASNDREKFIAAHYVARLQDTIDNKLHWDQIALDFAGKVEDQEVKGALPSLYLNIAKGFEDLCQREKALENYQNALAHTGYLKEDSYGEMTKKGILNGIDRVNELP